MMSINWFLTLSLFASIVADGVRCDRNSDCCSLYSSNYAGTCFNGTCSYMSYDTFSQTCSVDPDFANCGSGLIPFVNASVCRGRGPPAVVAAEGQCPRCFAFVPYSGCDIRGSYGTCSAISRCCNSDEQCDVCYRCSLSSGKCIRIDNCCSVDSDCDTTGSGSLDMILKSCSLFDTLTFAREPNYPGECVAKSDPPGVCSSNLDCSDGNPMTSDSCTHQTCCHVPISSGQCTKDSDCRGWSKCSLDICTENSTGIMACAKRPKRSGCCDTSLDCSNGHVCCGGGICAQSCTTADLLLQCFGGSEPCGTSCCYGTCVDGRTCCNIDTPCIDEGIATTCSTYRSWSPLSDKPAPEPSNASVCVGFLCSVLGSDGFPVGCGSHPSVVHDLYHGGDSILGLSDESFVMIRITNPSVSPPVWRFVPQPIYGFDSDLSIFGVTPTEYLPLDNGTSDVRGFVVSSRFDIKHVTSGGRFSANWTGTLFVYVDGILSFSGCGTGSAIVDLSHPSWTSGSVRHVRMFYSDTVRESLPPVLQFEISEEMVEGCADDGRFCCDTYGCCQCDDSHPCQSPSKRTTCAKGDARCDENPTRDLDICLAGTCVECLDIYDCIDKGYGSGCNIAECTGNLCYDVPVGDCIVCVHNHAGERMLLNSSNLCDVGSDRSARWEERVVCCDGGDCIQGLTCCSNETRCYDSGIFPACAVYRDFEVTFVDMNRTIIRKWGITATALGADGAPVPGPTNNTGVHDLHDWYHDSRYSVHHDSSNSIVFEQTGENWILNARRVDGSTGPLLQSWNNFFPLDGLGANPHGDYGGHNFYFTLMFSMTYTQSASRSCNPKIHIKSDDDLFVFADGQLVIDNGGIHSVDSSNVVNDLPGANDNNNHSLSFFYAERHITAAALFVQIDCVDLTPGCSDRGMMCNDTRCVDIPGKHCDDYDDCLWLQLPLCHSMDCVNHVCTDTGSIPDCCTTIEDCSGYPIQECHQVSCISSMCTDSGPIDGCCVDPSEDCIDLREELGICHSIGCFNHTCVDEGWIEGCCVSEDDCSDSPCHSKQCLDHACVDGGWIEGCCLSDENCTDLSDPCLVPYCNVSVYLCHERITPECMCGGVECDPVTQMCCNSTCCIDRVEGSCCRDLDCNSSDPCLVGYCDYDTNICGRRADPACACGENIECDPMTHRCCDETYCILSIEGSCCEDDDCDPCDPCIIGSCDLDLHECEYVNASVCMCGGMECDPEINVCCNDTTCVLRKEGVCCNDSECDPHLNHTDFGCLNNTCWVSPDPINACGNTTYCDPTLNTCCGDGFCVPRVRWACCNDSDCIAPTACLLLGCDQQHHECWTNVVPDCICGISQDCDPATHKCCGGSVCVSSSSCCSDEECGDCGVECDPVTHSCVNTQTGDEDCRNSSDVCDVSTCSEDLECVHHEIDCMGDYVEELCHSRGCHNCTEEIVEGCELTEEMFPCDPMNGCSNSSYPMVCSDGNPCTIDECVLFRCGTEAKCEHREKRCPPNLECNRSTGECEIHVCEDCDVTGCDDGDLCTIDRLDPKTGSCIHEPKICDDGNACTADACDEGSCVHILIKAYDDGDLCTVEECDPATGAMKVVRKITCGDDGDGDACTFLACGPDATCVKKTMDCGPASHGPCATAKCVGGRCVDFGVPLCKMDITAPQCGSIRCDADLGGCVVDTDNCDDGNPCTVDECTTKCDHRPTNCSAVLRASLGRRLTKCEIPKCSAKQGGCYVERIDCEDGNPCTVDSCNDATGKCVRTPKECGCSSAGACVDCGCSKDSGGCWRRPKSCDDGDPSTLDWCEPKHGCRSRRSRCARGEPLTSGCKEYDDGCRIVAVDCDDGDPCTVDRCSNSTCVHSPRCPWNVADDGCWISGSNCDASRGGVCKNPDRISCDDGDACTNDVCRGAACEHATMDCPSCSECYGGRCVTKDCDDGDPHTVDACASGKCIHSQVARTPIRPPSRVCDDVDGDPCTSERMREGKCTSEPLCGPPRSPLSTCSFVRCERLGSKAAICIRSPTRCDDGDDCTVDSCSEGVGCVHSPVDCDDRDACTVDFCKPGGMCAHAPLSCNDGDPQTVDSCVGGKCLHVTCDDDLACTDDRRDLETGECIHSPVKCPAPTDACTSYACIEPVGVCAPMHVECEQPTFAEGYPCVTASCDTATGSCRVSVIDCGDGDACTVDECRPTPDRDGKLSAGCFRSALDCDDRDACTVDSCDSRTGCIHSPVKCDPRDECDQTTGTCVAINCAPLATDACETCEYSEEALACVCERKTCDDGDACTEDSCDSTTGACDSVKILCSERPCMISEGCSEGACRYSEVTCACNATTGMCDGPDATFAVGPCRPAVSDPCDTFERKMVGGECERIGRKDCSDTDICTIDSCDSSTGDCIHAVDPCDDGDSCTTDSCDGGCVHSQISCDDGNACTTDACSDGICIHIPSAIGEARSACDPMDGKIAFATAQCGDCDDGDNCTSDSCVGGSCQHSDVTCSEGGPCVQGSCVRGSGCVYVDIECGPLESGIARYCDPITMECRARTDEIRHHHHDSSGAKSLSISILAATMGYVIMILQ